MKRAVISWPALVVWTAVFLCLFVFFLFQQAGEDKHTRVGNHVYIHSRSMNAWYSKLMIACNKVELMSNKVLQ